jgi:hypothetical protein
MLCEGFEPTRSITPDTGMPRCLIEWSFRTKLVPLLTAMRRASYVRARDTERRSQ